MKHILYTLEKIEMKLPCHNFHSIFFFIISFLNENNIIKYTIGGKTFVLNDSFVYSIIGLYTGKNYM